MRFSRKIEKAFSGEGWQSAARHTRALIRNRRFPARISLGSVLRSIDRARFAEIRQEYANPSAPVDAPPKYLELEEWMRVNLQRVRELELDYAAPGDILDLGCGAGYFLYLCKKLGHRVVGLDVDDLAMFRELTNLLGIPRLIARIEPFQPLPYYGKQFDLITAHLICFNGHKSKHLWEVPEWEYFLSDLASHLKPNGRVWLELNREFNGDYYSPALRSFFEERGARLDAFRVIFNPGVLAPRAVVSAAR